MVAEGTSGATGFLSSVAPLLDPHPIFYPVTKSCLGSPTLARRHTAPAEIGGSGGGRTVGRPCSLPVRNAHILEANGKAT